MTGHSPVASHLCVTQGIRLKLSQAAAHPRRGTNYTRNGISCKEWTTCYTTKEEKAKEKNLAAFKDLDARNDASKWELAGVISCSKNETGLQNFHDGQFGRANHENQ